MSRLLYFADYAHLLPYQMQDKRFSKIECTRITADLCGWKNALYWNIATLGKTKAYVVYDGKTCIHFSYVVKGREKFPFLNEKDIEIGPCWTHPEYRGLGIYPAVLSHIIQKELSDGGTAYMIISDSNQASQRGVTKVGFQESGSCVVRDFWRRHRIEW